MIATADDLHISVPIISAVIGAVILLFGRKLFWLCVAALGFAAGVQLATHVVHEPSAMLQLTFYKNLRSVWPVSSRAAGLRLVSLLPSWCNTARTSG
jgi:hypothetical protein